MDLTRDTGLKKYNKVTSKDLLDFYEHTREMVYL